MNRYRDDDGIAWRNVTYLYWLTQRAPSLTSCMILVSFVTSTSSGNLARPKKERRKKKKCMKKGLYATKVPTKLVAHHAVNALDFDAHSQ